MAATGSQATCKASSCLNRLLVIPWSRRCTGNEAVMTVALPHPFSWPCYAATAWSDFGLDQFWDTVMSDGPMFAFVKLDFALH